MEVTELLPITKVIYHQMCDIAWIMLGPLFLLSCVIEYAKEPHNFPAWIMLRKVILTVILLCIFPEISGLISKIGNELANKISERHALDLLYAELNNQAEPKNQLASFPFLLTADSMVGGLNYISYAAVFLAKYIMTALFHFLWSVLLAIAPLAILCNLFRSAGQVTIAVIRSMIEISSWNVIWQILAEMLLGLSILHKTGNYWDAICFNFFIALGMIGTPYLVHALVRTGLSSPGNVSTGTMGRFVTAPLKATQALKPTTYGKGQ